MVEVSFNWEKKARRKLTSLAMAVFVFTATLSVGQLGVGAAQTEAGAQVATAGNADSTTPSNGTTDKVTTAGNGSAIVTGGNGTVVDGGSTATSTAIASITLSKKTYTYNGKAKTPAVTVKDANGNVIASANYTVAYSNNKKVGKAKVTVTGTGSCTGTKSATFKIKPKKTSISKIQATAKGFKVTWKKQATQTTGYQVRYSTTSKFTAGKTTTIKLNKNTTTSKSVTKLSANKKYYVQVRTYKTVGGKTYYSGWSSSVIVTTRK